MKKVFAAIAACALMLGGCASGTGEAPATAERETVYQEATLQNLMNGDYYGSISAADLAKKGDTGIGTFDALNGELIMTDGVIYRAAGDGSVEAVKSDEMIPYCTVSFMDADKEETIKDIKDFDSLLALLDERVKELGENYFYMVKIEGTFPVMNARSEYSQKEPYKPLAEVLKTDQTFFNYENIEGTCVGIYCPSFMDGLNTPGWHLHFVSKDHDKGGHVTGLSISEAVLTLDQTPGFEMSLPDSEIFNKADFSVDQSEAIEEVEKPVTD